MSTKSLRIGNCSGYLGDNLAAALQLVRHGNIDVLTGDYLAELTMAVFKDRIDGGKKPGYAEGFLTQLRQIAKECQERGIKIIVNAGGLETARMAEDAKAILAELNVNMKVAHVEGDDLVGRMGELQATEETLTHMDDNIPLADVQKDGTTIGTANAYQGCWGPVEALKKGAGLVITGRGMDAAPVMAAAAAHFGWERHDYDKLAGALAAGHAIECGTQVTGGNFAGFDQVPGFSNMGYGIAEIYEDGSADITMPQADDIGGMVTVDTVTAQLLYEIRGHQYFGPDVILNLTTGQLEQKAPNVVRMSGFRGRAPTGQSKVCINIESLNPDYQSKPPRQKGELKTAFNLSAMLGLAGLDREAKTALYEAQLRGLLDQTEYEYKDIKAEIVDSADPHYQFLKITATTESKDAMRAFNAAKFGLLLSTYPGAFFEQTVSLSRGKVQTHWPAMIGNEHLREKVWVDGEMTKVLPTSQIEGYDPEAGYQAEPIETSKFEEQADEEYEDVPLGRLFYTRSGDKGGNANLGIWTRDEELYRYLCHYLMPETLRSLLPDMMKEFEIERHVFPNLHGVNFFVKGILGQGVASNNNIDQQAKALGEVLGAQNIPVPKRLIPQPLKKARIAPAPALAL